MFRGEVAMALNRVERHPVLEIPPSPDLVEFTFDGTTLSARRSEVISSALLANGVRVLSRHPKDDAPQGIFCANGQCGQCLVLADGLGVKACMTPVRAGMKVETLRGAPPLPPEDWPWPVRPRLLEVETDVLIVGGGPAGLAAAIELGSHGARVVLCDDRPTLGGKLTLQTHNFFGSVDDCYAGQRGTAIARTLEDEARGQATVDLWTASPVVGVFDGGSIGVERQGKFTVVRPKRFLVAAGAREKMLAFPGADLPGVYGAGAFQTLVHRDLVKPSRRLLIVGGGNVGLIVAYQALQAGIDVVAVVEAMPECGGYKVHRDKILRLGVPVYTSHTVLRAEGKDRVERVLLARVDETLRPIPGTELAFAVDTVLIAVGLSSVSELYEEARRIGLPAYAAGDAQTIAEASAAMFSGKIAARTILRDLGYPVEVPERWQALKEVLGSHPGPVLGAYPVPSGMAVYPVIRCDQEIPCNPCTQCCVKDSIKIPEGNILGRPKLVGDCVGCLKCLIVCPGLAITLVDRRYDKSGARAKVTVPWEMPEELAAPGQVLTTTGAEGEVVGTGRVLRTLSGKSLGRRRLLVLEVPAGEADRVAGVRVRVPEAPAHPEGVAPNRESDIVVCRCERVSRATVADYIRATGTRDVNAVKAALRCGMGPCGGKTCTELTLRVFRELGVDPRAVTPPVHRPFVEEVPLRSFVEEGDAASGV